MPHRFSLVIACGLGLFSYSLRAADPAPKTDAPAGFRTDGGNDKLPWYQLKEGQFPPEGSAHYIGGELTAMDHINRSGAIRQDRTDAIRRSEWDRTLPFTLLACGSLYYHGAPAALRDFPIGTHLHGLFYLDEKDGKGPFTRVIRFEDDFSYFARQHRIWKVNAVDLEKGTLSVTVMDENGEHADAKPTLLQIIPATRVWKGHGFGSLKDLAAGQSLLVNLTVCTLKGPGRCTDIWLDPESRALAFSLQREVNNQFEREHGLAGRVDEVDNKEAVVTMTLFDGFDPKLLEDFVVNESVTSAVAEESLRTYDQNSDRMKGDLLEVQHIPVVTGNSGIRLKFRTSTLLEGQRPGRILRIWSSKWKVDDLPKEERIYQ
jgi:hypothetical protein